ncbi:NADH-quinone oxidoreductase subunit L [Wolbachia endosymbiont of Dirofilaria (Dirofilaria) immitis]|uniref:NADH-quinone oxidoreductase subunit L n=1 Tax=Wolbachia endosymbiont of Dirofilaria (Dirofilaria) immitis TaxID=1812115 RepID=UPI001588F14D|nr:NADH-quinone oxidoreductase subunit L [Wolbachia endosymbiont of Dirofilaria (Dirofilaria) immitis]QKX02429.1 NADH-quinone oxidoreductase subunit L [Wolbachia endosymbiont of Dirofilaria (Dirofilaria) immitis]
MMNVLKLIVFLPLFSSLFVALLRKSILSQLITTVGVGISAVLSWYVFLTFSKNYHLSLFPLLSLSELKVNWAISVDTLSSLMLVIVTTISLVVHLYSIGYMEHDRGKSRFFSYLSLFTFCMIVLVVSDNFVQLFFGWEGVGLCSYLLIGFWFEKYSANSAALKAFVINRVGDFALLIGIFLIYYTFHSLKFTEIFNTASLLSIRKIRAFCCEFKIIDIICVLLFVGCMGKSAQLGLHVWLPDAMEGPTPVSALIHAATMVTAGVFLVARCSLLFELSGVARELIIIVGTLTAFFAATVAITQNDIKKIIAYSTCSQLGYMFIACGLSAYNIAVFHLMTHAFLKALLFLGAGNVIRVMNYEQNIQKIGNCWKKIPYTYASMWIGSLSLSGIFPFAGFYSKDLIIEHAYSIDSFAFVMSLVVVFFTAFYSWRVLLLVFHSQKQSKIDIYEVPIVMLIPLLILTFGSVFSGIWGVKILDITSDVFWKSSLVVADTYEIHNAFIRLLPTLVSLSGILLSFLIYYYQVINQIKSEFLLKFLQNKWYFDEIYEFFIIVPTKVISKLLYKFDVRTIDSFGPNGVVRLVNECSKNFIKLQTGYIFDYAFIMFVALISGALYIIGIL